MSWLHSYVGARYNYTSDNMNLNLQFVTLGLPILLASCAAYGPYHPNTSAEPLNSVRGPKDGRYKLAFVEFGDQGSALDTSQRAAAHRLPASRRFTRHQVFDSLFAQRIDKLRPREPLSGRTMATDGCTGGIEWDASVRADHRLSVRHDSEGLAAGQQRMAPGGLGQGYPPWNSRERELSVCFWNQNMKIFLWSKSV
jgi:hypothetical protein